MTSENNNSRPAGFGVFSVLTPVLVLASLFLGMFMNTLTYSEYVSGAAYALCFSFVYVFYADNHETGIFAEKVKILLAIVSPALAFFALYMSYESMAAAILLLSISLLAVFADMTLAMYLVAAVSGYSVLFVPSTLGSVGIILVLVLLICILSEKIKDIGSLLFAVLLVLLLFAVLSIVMNGFVLTDAFSPDDIVTALVAVLVLVCVYMFGRLVEENPEEAVIKEEEKSPTDHDIKVLNRELNSAKKLNEKLAASGSEAKEEANRIRQEYIELEAANRALENEINVLKNRTISIEEAISEKSEYAKDLSAKSQKLYRHCLQIARISADASELIGCDQNLGFAIGLYHEAQKFLGEDFTSVLRDTYRIPEYLIRQISKIKDKNNSLPITREAGIVLLCDDIVNTANYLSKNKNESVSMERIVSNAIRVRKDQNVLRLAGFSNEEVQLLKLYFIDKGGSYDTSD